MMVAESGTTEVASVPSAWGLAVIGDIQFRRGSDGAGRVLSPTQWMRRFAPRGACETQLVLEYLPGHEYSVDVVAYQGRCLRAVARKKSKTTIYALYC